MVKRDACHFAAKGRCINDGAEGFISKYHTSHITHHAHQMLQRSRIAGCWICNVPVQNMGVRAGAFQGSALRAKVVHMYMRRHAILCAAQGTCTIPGTQLSPSVVGAQIQLSSLFSLSSLPAASHFHPRIKLRPSTATL